MRQTIRSAKPDSIERSALSRRVKQFYQRLNEEDWKACYALIDPRLTERGRVDLDAYSERMHAFKKRYGSVRPWQKRISLHLDASASPRDKRPFAYVYVIWQDDAHGFHMFRERWIKENGRWFTRVVGLVPNKQETSFPVE